MKIEDINNRYFLDLFFLSILLLSLPIAGVTAVQNISFVLFIIICFVVLKGIPYKKVLSFQTYLIIISGLIVTSLISIYFSIEPKETISEIRGELVKPFILSLIVFLFIYIFDDSKIKKIFFILFVALFFHTILNIYIWIDNGLWPFRAGGLLDSGGGERFGIWTTYSLAMAIALFFTKYKKIAILFFLLSLVSIIGNNTRATFIGMIMILFFFFSFFYKNKIFKYSIITLITLSITSFIIYSKNLETRYNAFNVVSAIKHMDSYSPREYDKLVTEHGLEHSTTARLAMWKSVLLYRGEDLFTPQGYGRFLYGKSISKIYEDKKENIPYMLFAQTHNDYMTIFFSLGLIGLLFFLALFAYLLKILYYIFIYSSDYKAFAVFAFLGTIGYMSSMMFGSFFGDSEKIYFYILYGITLALYLKTKEQNLETN